MNAISPAAMAEVRSGVSHRALRCNNLDNLASHIAKLGDACIAGQYLREIIMNSREAILRIPEASRGDRRIIIDAAHEILPKGLMKAAAIGRSASKFAFLDQGCGMDGPAMVRHIGGIFDSADGASNNHGIGARIATFKANPHGVTFLSWTDARSDGAMVRMEANAGGGLSLRVLRPGTADEDERAWAPIPAALCPEDIRAAGSGTVVVLHGAAEDDDTTRHPEAELPGGGYAVVRYLSSRFAMIEPGISITAQRRWTDVRKRLEGGERQGEGGTRLNIIPAFEGLRRICEHYEAVRIHNADAHVFLMKEDFRTVHESEARLLPQGGTTAVLHDGELYEFPRDNDELTKRIARFGVPLAHEQVVILIEPKAAPRSSKKGPPCSSDITRGRLQWHPDGDAEAPSPDLPWNRWCVEFMGRMPAFLRDHVNDAVAKRTRDGEGTFDVASLLKANERALMPMRVRVDPNGAESCGDEGSDVLAPAGAAAGGDGGCDAGSGASDGARGPEGAEASGGGTGGSGDGAGRAAPSSGTGAGTGEGPSAWSDGSAAPAGGAGERSEGRGSVAASQKTGPKQRFPRLLFAKADDPRTIDAARYDIDANTLVLDTRHNTVAGARAKEHRPGRTPEILPAVDLAVDEVVGNLICMALMPIINDRRRSREEISAATSPAALTAIAAAVVVGGSDKIREHVKKQFGSGEIGKGRGGDKR